MQQASLAKPPEPPTALLLEIVELVTSKIAPSLKIPPPRPPPPPPPPPPWEPEPPLPPVAEFSNIVLLLTVKVPLV